MTGTMRIGSQDHHRGPLPRIYPQPARTTGAKTIDAKNNDRGRPPCRREHVEDVVESLVEEPALVVPSMGSPHFRIEEIRGESP